MFNRKDEDQEGRKQRAGAVAFMPGGLFDMAVASVFINILALAMPLALLQIFDRVIPGADDGTLLWLIVGVVSALALEAMLRVGRSYVGGWMGARSEHLTGVGAMERLLGADITEFDKRGAGAYLERLNALGLLREYYAGQVAGAVFDLPFVVVYLGVIAYLAGYLVLVPAALIVLFAAGALALGRLRPALRERMLADDRRFGFLIEVLEGIHTVKGLAMEEQMLRRYERLQETCAENDYRLAAHERTALGLGSLLTQLVILGVAGVGAVLVIDGELTVGALLASIVLAARAAHPAENIAGAWTRIQNANLARDRLGEIFTMPADKPAGLLELPQIEGAIDFENLTFSYGKGKDGEDLPPIFRDQTLRIEPGQTVGVVGSSASGKTTLLYLIMGVLTPTEGVARIDGYNLRECEPENVRHQVAYLPQEAVVFKGTVLENLTMFRDERAGDALDIAKVMGLDNVAASLPLGYDTPIGEGAEDKMPRGTRQRIAIARALVDKPRVLLFDEANSFIDGAGDATLRSLLERLKGRVTLVLVTQRPSMLRLADRILEIRGDTLFEHPLQARRAEAAGERPEAT
ncbi:MAG: peptidase domain-containing ABC transporter [Rhodospirillales bacterium]